MRQIGVFFPGTPVSFTNKTDHHNITEILLKVALNTINQPTNQPDQLENKNQPLLQQVITWKTILSTDGR